MTPSESHCDFVYRFGRKGVLKFAWIVKLCFQIKVEIIFDHAFRFLRQKLSTMRLFFFLHVLFVCLFSLIAEWLHLLSRCSAVHLFHCLLHLTTKWRFINATAHARSVSWCKPEAQLAQVSFSYSTSFSIIVFFFFLWLYLLHRVTAPLLSNSNVPGAFHQDC